jgi:hypothetical protein
MDISIAWGDGPMSFHKDRTITTTFDILEGPKPPLPKNLINYDFGNVKFEKYNKTDFQVTIIGTFDTFVGLLYGHVMNSTDVNVVEFLPQDNTTKYTIYDGWSAKYGRPQTDLELGGTNDINNVEYSILNGKPIITYLRKYKTGDKFDKDIELVNHY